MSTLKVTAIKNASSSANNLVFNSDGTLDDPVGNVRTPRRTAITTATSIANEGVYYCTNAPTLTLGAPADGSVMTIYNLSLIHI